MTRTDALSDWCTPVLPRRCRLRLVFFLVRMWRKYAWLRLIPPPGRFLKRLAAARLVFNLGISFPVFWMSARCLPRWQDFGDPDRYFFAMSAAASAATLVAPALAGAAVFFCTSAFGAAFCGDLPPFFGAS